MRRANFIVGFHSWGKSTIIKKLFEQQNFYYHLPYNIRDIPVQFIVQSVSNDDIGKRIIEDISSRLNKTKEKRLDIFATLCPSIEDDNDFRQILQNRIFRDFGQFNLFLIRYKWDHHAELMIDNIKKSFKGLSKIKCIVIDADKGLSMNRRLDAKVNQIRTQLNSIY